jgi:hypothetical protein
MLTLTDTPSALTCWNEEINAVEMTWKGHVASEAYRQSLVALLDTLQSRKASLILIDSRKLQVILPDDQTWTNTVFVPRATALGLRKLASVMPESVVAQLSIDKLVRKANESTGGLAYQLVAFDTPEKARAWLKQ